MLVLASLLTGATAIQKWRTSYAQTSLNKLAVHNFGFTINKKKELNKTTDKKHNNTENNPKHY